MRMTIATFLWVAVRVVSAQTQPNVAEILQKVSETYKIASEYEFVIDVTAHDPRTKKDLPGHTQFAFRSPNKYRMEMDGTASSGAISGSGLIVDDGSNVWMYMGESNQYGVISADKLTADAPGDLGDLNPKAMDQFMMWRYRGATDFAGNAKSLREETIEFGGTRVGCYVVEVFPNATKAAYTWWIDKNRYLILREDDAGNSAVFKTIKLNEPLPDGLFQFVAPPGAQKIEMQ
jgi:outer membrane lipoprotein-sorting protein